MSSSRTAQRARSIAAAALCCVLAGWSAGQADEQDDRIKLRITNRMAGQVSLSLQGFTVDVAGGVATLRGSVASVGQRVHVERLVKGVVGVEEVRNNLAVRAPDRGDLGIQSDIDVLLDRRTKFRDNPITAIVGGTEVTLTGTTDRALDRLDAETLAAGVPGVTRVINRIEVVGPAASNPDVASRVTSLLVNPLTFGVVRGLEVQVDGGRVVLGGSVLTESDRDAAERLALSVPGVSSVTNNLTIVGR